MNISTGGPHILLFERDQQLTALLISEFQLAGYECHTAHTAVEVFDAIARHPIQLVLVNVAQVAATRREFWVALDTQRRGRGVQVLSFQCFDFAGYGPQDAEERPQIMHVDIEVGDMHGLIELVNAVKARLSDASTTNTMLPTTKGENTSLAGSDSTTHQQPYADSIRAVLYPSQRSWTPQNSGSTAQEISRLANEVQNALVASTNGSALQHLVNGNLEGQPESSLAQLSRLLQEQQISESTVRRPVARVTEATAALATAQPSTPSQGMARADTAEATTKLASNNNASRPTPMTEDTDTQVLRVSPIQDIAIERPKGVQGSAEGGRRAESKSSQAQTASASVTPLASVTTPIQATNKEIPTQPPASLPIAAAEEETEEEDNSLPPISAPPSQAPQQQVLQGRATRSLGSVLLAGHLVQQNRLEVAQNIQRMLRGVDLNYQLEEILLMFKLLTPDQMLAASLVSYGLISTTQISALGRIRQELHSIGLEYDLENLLILFRILSPEQLREVKSGWQG
jgi:hypothetical protein